MPRVDLRVPYGDKDEAKRLGARWDPAARVWFAPEDLELARFARWLPIQCLPNVRAPSYMLAASTHSCWRCNRASRIHGFVLPAGHETLDSWDDSDTDSWELAEEPTLLCYLEWLAPAVGARITSFAPHYRLAFGADSGSLYWTNHCEFCGAPFGDHETYCEPGQGFLAFTLEEARRITLSRVEEPFAANCGSYSFGVTLFEEMRRL